MKRGRRAGRRRTGGGGAEALIHKRLQEFGVNELGRDWIMRALHPAGDKESPGIPDQSSTFVLRPDFRVTATISPPTSAAQWDCFMWAPPGDTNCLYWATAPSPANFAGSIPPAGSQVGVINLQDLTYSDPSYSYAAFVPDSARVHNGITNVPSLRAAAFRHQFKSITVEQIASAVADTGQVYAAQFSPLLHKVGGVYANGILSRIPIPGTSPTQYYENFAEHYTCVLPADEVSLTRMNPDAYVAPSRDGVYMPLRLSGPVQPFVRSVAGPAVHVYNGLAGYLNTDASSWPVGAAITPINAELALTASANIPWVFAFPLTALEDSGTPPHPVTLTQLNFDTGYDNVNTGVMIWRGLQGSSGGGFGSSLQVKVIAGLEIAPTPSQGDAVFTQHPAPFEPRALEAYYKLCLELKDAYPARFNSFEDILGAIGDVVGKVWSNVEPAIVGGLSSIANAGVGMLQNAVGRRMARLGGVPPSMPLVRYRAPSGARSVTSSRGPRRLKSKGK